MQRIELSSMKIRNFKGFKEFEFTPSGKNQKIEGENGTGKSSIYDAFSWVLFGKDSHDSSAFAWKPLDKRNKEINHLETEVEATLDIDGSELVLSRMVSEKWTRKRGSDSKSFEGHETIYRIDGIKTTKTKYMKKIEEVIPEETFKQLTNVYFIAEVMKAKDRRSLLFSLVEEVSDQEVIDSKNELIPLNNLLNGRLVDDVRQLITEEKRNVNKDLDRIPDRIDEVDRSLPDLSKLDKEEIGKELLIVSHTITEVEEELASFSNGSRLTNLKSKLQTKEAELQTARSNYQIKQNESIEDLQNQRTELFDAAMEANNDLKDEESITENLQKEVETFESEIKDIEAEQNDLREEFKKVHAEIYPEFDEHKQSCSVCGQDYPEEKQVEIKGNYDREKEQFNINKAKRLEDINLTGKELTKKKESYAKSIEDKQEKLLDRSLLERLTRQRDKLKGQHEDIKKQIEEIKHQADPFEDSSVYGSINAQIDKIKLDIKKTEESADEQLKEKEHRLKKLKEDKEALQDKLYQFKQVDKQEQRKQELIEEEKTLSARYGELENQLYLLEEFVRTKVAMLTGRINKLFDFVEFKLFEDQINGGLKEVCEPLVNGIPFSNGLNSAARINAGLDIINSLSRLKGVSAPIFIDNSESITKIIDTEAQTIQLVVVEGQNELKIEGVA
ncbi:AAA family ATPase [Marinilactibacillus sp. Marseille-P9653]|uniref:AAA family ATPase n=1 Tax=Marinilactibacillus sp. Marseille-P9653 TaxID=2866583 RepID=UPI001CE4474D|nr:AAA family ATPase [Marinilactibacillus sp. Marseille-P9653]